MKSPHEDPVLRSARRETLVVLIAWVAALSYTVGYSWWQGYDRPPDDLTFIFGFPDWVFWGVLVPWVVCVLFSWWFAYAFMTDEPLGDDPDDAGDEPWTEGAADHAQ